MALIKTICVVTRFANGAYAATRIYPSNFDDLSDSFITVILGPNTTPADLFLPDDSVLPDGGETKVFKIPSDN